MQLTQRLKRWAMIFCPSGAGSSLIAAPAQNQPNLDTAAEACRFVDITRRSGNLLLCVQRMLRLLEELVLQAQAFLVDLDRPYGFDDLARPLLLVELAEGCVGR